MKLSLWPHDHFHLAWISGMKSFKPSRAFFEGDLSSDQRRDIDCTGAHQFDALWILTIAATGSL